MERRKRIARPIPIIVFGILFLILPILNYINFAYQFQIPFQNFVEVVKTVDTIAVVLSIIPLLLELGYSLLSAGVGFCFLRIR